MFVPLTTITLAELIAARAGARARGCTTSSGSSAARSALPAIATLLAHDTRRRFAPRFGEHIAVGDPSVTCARRHADPRHDGAWRGSLDGAPARARDHGPPAVGQASVLAYSQIYVLSAALILCLIPLLLLVRQTKGAGGGHAIME